MLDEAREKDEQSKVWLPFKEFLQDEYRRMNRVIVWTRGRTSFYDQKFSQANASSSF
jgi:hypothetical protein